MARAARSAADNMRAHVAPMVVLEVSVDASILFIQHSKISN